MFRKLKERYLLYPAIFIVMAMFLFGGSEPLAKSIYDTLVVTYYDLAVDQLNISMSKTVFLSLYGYVFGYLYGTFSQLIKVHKIKGLLQIVLFIAKAILTAMLVPYGVVLLIIETIFLPFALKAKKKRQAQKEAKEREETIELMRQSIREELAEREMKEQVYQEVVQEQNVNKA